LAYNSAAAPEATEALRRVFGETDVAGALHAFGQRIGAPASLAALGLREGDLDRAAHLATARPYPNPRPIEYRGIRALLDDAYHGRSPGASAGAAG
jgi:maleylacetate reductase